jgi:hypothetical protein
VNSAADRWGLVNVDQSTVNSNWALTGLVGPGQGLDMGRVGPPGPDMCHASEVAT